MNNPHSSLWGQFEEKWLSRRGLIRGAAGTVLGAGLAPPNLVYARDEDDDSENGCVAPNPIPGGVAPLNTYGIFVHHNPLNAGKPLANISDPSQITDFDGFVGLTHIRGGGTDVGTGNRLAFQADMGFSQGRFIRTDGQQHRGTLAFV